MEDKETNNLLVADVKTLLWSSAIIILFVALAYFFSSRLSDTIFNFVFGLSGVFFGAGSAYYFITSFIRIVSRIIYRVTKNEKYNMKNKLL